MSRQTAYLDKIGKLHKEVNYYKNKITIFNNRMNVINNKILELMKKQKVESDKLQLNLWK